MMSADAVTSTAAASAVVSVGAGILQVDDGRLIVSRWIQFLSVFMSLAPCTSRRIWL